MQSREILKGSDQGSEPQQANSDNMERVTEVNANECFQSTVLKVHIQIVPQIVNKPSVLWDGVLCGGSG